MSLTDAAYIKGLAPWMNSVPDGDFAEHIVDAELRLRDWVGDSEYDGAASDGTTTNRGKKLKLAESYLTIASMLPGLNMVYGDAGLALQTTQMEGNVSYMTPRQVQETVRQYVRKAEDKASAYISAGGTVLRAEADENDPERYL